MRKRLLVLIILINVVLFAKATEQPLAQLGEEQAKDYTSLLYLSDSFGSFEEIIDANYTLYDPKVKLHYDKKHWLRLKAVNTTDRNTRFLFKIASKSAWRSNHLEAYVKIGDSVQYFRFGSVDKISELRGTPKRSEFPLYVSAGDSIEVYFKIYNTVKHYPKFSLVVETPDFVDKVASYIHSFHMFYEGLMWITVLINLVIFLMYRERIYLYYTGYILMSAIYTLFFYRYLLNTIFIETPILDPYVWIVSINSASMFYLLFLKHFIETKKHWSTAWERLLNGVIITKLIITLLLVIMFAITLNMRVVNDIIAIVIMVETLFSIVFIIRLLKTKEKKVYYFGAASLFLWVGFILGNTLYILSVGNGQIVSEMGIVGEILLFSLGLGYRMRENEILKRKAQGELIGQLETNKNLQEKVNRELESKVRERTAEIMQQQEEMLSQSEEIRDKNSALGKVNRQMTDSITYASYIQNAILGNPKDIIETFREAFIWLSPHSIVSGDFYWTTTVHKNMKDFRVIIAADCTGHGVRGAFMTVLGNDSLEEIVMMSKNVMPNEILRQMDRTIKRRLHNKHDAEHYIDDGMDMTVLTIDENDGIAYFSGAKSPLVYVRNGKITHIKGSKYAVGGSGKIKRTKVFDLHKIAFQPNDQFYLYSDGFQDQFGGVKNRKYLSHRFREFLLEISERPMIEQKVALEQEHDRWRGSWLQTDDILVLGIKV